MDFPPPGFTRVNDDMLSNDVFMQPFIRQAERGNENVLCVQTEDGMFHRVIGIELDGLNGRRFYFEENIGENIPGNPVPSSLSLQNIIDNPMRFTLYVNSGAQGPGGGAGAGGAVASSGYHRTSSKVV